MAKNFGKSGSAKQVLETVKTLEKTKAQVIALQNIHTNDLIDNPENNEDVSYTEDLEMSMKEIGFTDPLEVTDYKMEPGKYMILSGHRRRRAGVKVGFEYFPCLVRHFDGEDEMAKVMKNVRYSNIGRNSASDPFLMTTRYMNLENDMIKSGDTKDMRERIATILHLSPQQADRYKAMARLIVPVMDLVREGEIGMTSVQPLCTHTPEEQAEILDIIKAAMHKGARMSRENVKLIVDGYRDGKRTWMEIANLPRESGIPMNAFMNTDPSEPRESSEYNRNSEVRRDFDPIAAEADKDDAARAEWERQQAEEKEDDNEFMPKPELDEIPDDVDDLDPETEQKNKAMKAGKDMMATLKKLCNLLDEVKEFEDKTVATEAVRNMGSMAQKLVDDMVDLAVDYGILKDCKEPIQRIQNTLKNYKF